MACISKNPHGTTQIRSTKTSVDMDTAPTIISLKKQQELQGIATLALLGSVASGKTSICKFLTGETTQKHSKELVNGCTIKMGYKNLKVYYNDHEFITNPKVVPEGYRLVRHFSIADNPGHNSFMATLITGLNDIDYALFLISGTNGIEPQTLQHFKCFKSTQIKDLSMIISKVDLVKTREKLNLIVDKIDEMLADENLDEEIDPPIIPVSAITKANTNNLIKLLVSRNYPRNIIDSIKKDFKMTIIRTFDTNKPGTSIDNIEGGVLGGSIQGGYLAVGDTICVLPGNVTKTNGKTICNPLVTQVMELRSDTSQLNVALSGGFIGIRTTLDFYYSKADRLVGNVIIKIKDINDINNYCKIIDQISVSNIEQLTDRELVVGQEYLIAIHASTQISELINIDDDVYTFKLNYPVAIFRNDIEKVAIMTNENNSLEMLSYGIISNSVSSDDIILHYAEDVQEFFEDLPIKEQISNIIIHNDLEVIPEFEQYVEELYDTTELISQIHFENKEFILRRPVFQLSKDTTSVTISNAHELMSLFTSDNEIIVKLCDDFGNYLKSSYSDDMRQASINTDGNFIRFNNLKKTNRKFFINEFNQKFSEYIKEKLTCKSCGMCGSIVMSKKDHSCRHCNAVLMVMK
jgi:translation initiation factor 2 subunit 3